MTRVFAILILCPHIASCEKTTHPPHQSQYVSLSRADPLPAFDVYFTWHGYEPTTLDHRQVEFIWNGESIGVGDPGIRALLARLKELKAGSRVLIYPSYERSLYKEDTEPNCYPWQNSIADFWKAAIRRQLILIHSPRDHRGNMLPECASWYFGRPDLDILAGLATRPTTGPSATMPARAQPSSRPSEVQRGADNLRREMRMR